ncbi:tetratricopeptide repeat protein [Xanthomonas phaseoli]|uniref:tetratricopeptide repeat-containing sulfotransferase family protein n=1 Tax=Xanthomonas phaseoli TaxID=1985254 RepID=UPI003B00D99D
MNTSDQRAAHLLQQGHLQQAIAAYQSIVRDRPHAADAWYNLGYLFRRTGDIPAALQAYAQALACGAAAPEQIHLNRAVLLSEHLDDAAAALQELELALHCRPAYPPALLNLGNLHEELGARAHAIAAYTQLLAIAPVDPATRALQLQAAARLLHLNPPTAVDDPRMIGLTQAISVQGLEPPLVATVLHALAHAYDRLGQHRHAFDTATAANRHAYAQVPTYDPQRTQRHFDALMAAFDRVAVESTPLPHAGAHDATPALFICGMFRSGSTLIEHALSSHSQVAAGGEMDALPRLVAQRLSPFPQTVSTLSQQMLAQLALSYRRHLDAVVPDQAQLRYITDKRPDNFQLIGLIKRLFPSTRIVHTRRHPLDNGLSIFMQQLNPHGFGYAGKLEDIGHFYGAYHHLMNHWMSLYPDSIHTFDYDAFVAAPEPTLRALLEFLQLPWEPACLDFHLAERAVRTASYWQVRRPLHGEASGRWRSYATQLAPLRIALGKAGVPLPD